MQQNLIRNPQKTRNLRRLTLLPETNHGLAGNLLPARTLSPGQNIPQTQQKENHPQSSFAPRTRKKSRRRHLKGTKQTKRQLSKHPALCHRRRIVTTLRIPRESLPRKKQNKNERNRRVSHRQNDTTLPTNQKTVQHRLSIRTQTKTSRNRQLHTRPRPLRNSTRTPQKNIHPQPQSLQNAQRHRSHHRHPHPPPQLTSQKK